MLTLLLKMFHLCLSSWRMPATDITNIALATPALISTISAFQCFKD